MGLSIHIDDQIHRRSYCGPEAGIALSRILEIAPPVSLLSTVSAYGDTMFNIVQMRKILSELNDILREHQEMAEQIDLLAQVIDQAIRARGYVWMCGD